jgi:hypothetical protein
MNADQYERWKDFARRMVTVAVSSRKKKPSRAHTREIIEFFFECRMDPYDEWQRVKDWDYTGKAAGSNNYPMCVGDHIRDIAEYHVPGYWGLPDGERGEAKIDRWMGPATCCIRAGLDLAAAPSAGVIGFTAGDLRRMYPEGVPDWVKGEPIWETIGVKAVVPGIGFVPKPTGDMCSFDDLPDDAKIWI